MKIYQVLLMSVGLSLACQAAEKVKREYPKRLDPVFPVMPQGKYSPDPESTKSYPMPEWLLDAKLGIYTHWGPDTFGQEKNRSHIGWYGKTMYVDDEVKVATGGTVREGVLSGFEFHKQQFGDQHEYGLKDVCMDWKTPKFDAEAWADLFEKAGARFAGPVAVHHNNFLMWDSQISRWNSKLCGPQIDFTGVLEKAIRKRGMKFITTFHHGATWNYNWFSHKYDGADPQFSDLYTDHHDRKDDSNKNFNERFLGKVNEVITKYEPDLIWFDFGLRNNVLEEYRNRVFADYYNWADSKGKSVGVIHKHWDIFNAGNGIIDGEKRSFKRIADFPWAVDNSIHSGWFWHPKSRQMHTVDEMVYWFVDIISKGGVMLMNLGPQADGDFAPQVKETALKMGEWIKLNSEGIYDTRPWLTYGEGPTEFNKGLEVIWGSTRRTEYGKDGKIYMWKDIRYTRSKDSKTLYAFTLGWPQAEEITLSRVKVDSAGIGNTRGRVELIGHGEVDYSVNGKGQMVISIPKLKEVNEQFKVAPCFKITGMQLSKHGKIPYTDDRLKRGDIKKWEQITPDKYDAYDDTL